MNRVEELKKIIKDAKEELAEIRENCPHINLKEEINIVSGTEKRYICDYCGKYLGIAKSAKEWIEWFEFRAKESSDYNEKYKNNIDYLLMHEYSDDLLSEEQFKKLVNYNNLEENTKKWLKTKHRDEQIDNILNESKT